MKKSFVFFLIVLCIAPLASGCQRKSDSAMCEEHIGGLLSAVERKDAVAVKALIATEKASEITNVDSKINELLAYYEGTCITRKSLGYSVIDNKDGGNISKYYIYSYDVTTEIGVYRIALKWYSEDTAHPKNVGIWQLSILKLESDADFSYSFWSEANATSGIFVGRGGQ
jgi:hypothetical protein